MRKFISIKQKLQRNILSDETNFYDFSIIFYSKIKYFHK